MFLQRWWCNKYHLPRNHPLLLQSTDHDLLKEFHEDMIEAYITQAKEEDRVDVEVEDLQYSDVFPFADDDEQSFTSIIKRLMREQPHEEFSALLAKAKLMAERAKEEHAN